LCKHAAGRLRNGRLPGVAPRAGYVELRYRATDGSPAPVHVALTEDGADGLAAVIDCSQGGVAWPQVVLVYRPGLELLGSLNLGDIAHAEHSTVDGLTADGNTMRVSFVSTEGCCFLERHQTATVGWDGAHLVVRHLTTRWAEPKDQCSVADLETAWSGKDQNCLEPEVLSHLFYPGAPFTTDSADAYLQNVVFIQLRLRDLKYDVVIDGHYGPRTAAVVRKYQQDKGLTVDGETGLQTWKSLFGLGGTY
jgi:hypothetical protein